VRDKKVGTKGERGEPSLDDHRTAAPLDNFVIDFASSRDPSE
jgi:hypothetical protein